MSQQKNLHSDADLGGGAINEKPRLYQPHLSTSIQSKKRSTTYNPEENLSHLLHALVGLDRYPNYLTRWTSNEEDIDALERALEKQIQTVRQQRELLENRRKNMTQLIRQTMKIEDESNETSEEQSESHLPFPFRPPTTWEEVRKHVLHPKASNAIFRSKIFSKSSDTDKITVEDVLSGKTSVHLDPSFLQDWIDEEMFDVYSFPLLSNEVSNRVV